MLFPRPVEYGIRAMAYLAVQKGGKLSGAREISEAEQIPMPFLWKILRLLTQRRLIRSFKGVRGGYELARPAEEITLSDIVLATDGNDFREICVLGLQECSNQHPCALHDRWKGVRAEILDMMDHTTLTDFQPTRREPKRAK